MYMCINDDLVPNPVRVVGDRGVRVEAAVVFRLDFAPILKEKGLP